MAARNQGPATRSLRRLCVALLFLACSGDDLPPFGVGGDVGDLPSPSRPQEERPHVGPLANAGPDRFALPGARVVLDGRGSFGPEDGRTVRWRWTQESGPKVLLDDPHAPRTSFVAPPRRPGQPSTLLFRLQVDDGRVASRDRVAVYLVERPDALLPAPVAVSGADREVLTGAEVELELPVGLDPACLLEGGEPGCESAPLPFCYVQVAGAEVDPHDPCGPEPPTFVAPETEETLVFRLETHRPSESLHALHCGPEVEGPEPGPLCSAPDYVRVLVRRQPRRKASPPVTSLVSSGVPRERVDLRWLPEEPGAYPTALTLQGRATDPPDPDTPQLVPWNLRALRYRPALGTLPIAPMDVAELRVERPESPEVQAVILEASFARFDPRVRRLEWFHAVPSIAAIAWMPVPERPFPIADPGPPPCHGGSSVDEGCLPLVGGERAVLHASAHASGRDEGWTYCWEQLLGPPVSWEDPPGCSKSAERAFVAPAGPRGSQPAELLFELTVHDGGPLASVPAVLAVQLRPEGDGEALILDVDAPETGEAGAYVRLDASASRDPEGGGLRYLWRQIGGPEVLLEGCGGGALDATSHCARFVAPEVAGEDEVVRIELQAATEAGWVTLQHLSIPIREASKAVDEEAEPE